METIIISGDSKSNAKLILELAKRLNFTAKRLTSKEAEDIGQYYSIDEGLDSGIMTEEEKAQFLVSLKYEGQ